MGIKRKSVSLNNTGQFDGAGAGTISGTYTVNAGSQKVLFVVYCGRGRSANSVTYNGVNLTNYITQTSYDQCLTQWWYLINPPEGAYTLTANLSANSDSRDFLAVISLNNVDQVSPVKTYVEAQGNSSSISVNLSMTYDNTYVINANFNTGLLSGNAFTGWTLFAERDQSDSGGASYALVTTATGGVLQTGFTGFNPGDTAYRYLALEVQPADFDGGAFLYNFI
jgi:hypothetical protein